MSKKINHSLPLSPKTPERIKKGYDEDHFGENYWLHPDRAGNPRVERRATPIIEYVKMLKFTKVLPDEPRILDVGAGAGNMVKDFRDAGYQCEGTEFSESGRRISKEKFEITLSKCDLRSRIEEEDQSYDFAYCVGVLSMIPRDDMHVAIREIYRVLKNGGALLTSLLNPKPVDNEPHLTSMTYYEWRWFHTVGGFQDITSIWAPQRHGIGMNNEFAGLFLKDTE